MTDYEKLQIKHNKEISKLQNKCPHLESHWACGKSSSVETKEMDKHGRFIRKIVSSISIEICNNCNAITKITDNLTGNALM